VIDEVCFVLDGRPAQPASADDIGMIEAIANKLRMFFQLLRCVLLLVTTVRA
jgi:hypothetical protein